MAVSKSVNMVCDLCNYPSRAFANITTKAIKIELRVEGWRFRGGVHRCMTCVRTAGAPASSEETDEGCGEQ